MQAPGYGELLPDPEGIIDLPKGFTYRIISRAGMSMDDGLILPGYPDGMATFPGENGQTILIRNHEVDPTGPGPFGPDNHLFDDIDPKNLYDAGNGQTPFRGGTSTLIYDTAGQRVVSQFLSLAGTMRNCAGGPTPWNSWITCEETQLRAGRHGEIFADKDHGYNFEVPANATGLVPAKPLTAMGRFRHEAVAVDERSGIIYQTEDRDDGLIYRFIPEKPGQLSAGGRLQALKLKENSYRDTRNWRKSDGKKFELRRQFACEWIDMEDVTSPEDDLRNRGQKAGAAKFARGEGMWRGSDGIYFACTNGGRRKKGQIWRYIPGPAEGTPAEASQPGRLELFIEPNDGTLIENADNLTMAPWGDLIVCEDRSGEVIRLVGVTPAGKFYTLANNHLRSELAGACFSPDGTTLFVNIQGPGLTLAITGPWRAGIIPR